MLILLVGQDKILNDNFAKGLAGDTEFEVLNHPGINSTDMNILLSYYTALYDELIKTKKDCLLIDNHITNEVNRLVDNFNNDCYCSYYSQWREMEDDRKNNMLVIFINALEPNNLDQKQRLIYNKELFDICIKYTRLNWVFIKKVISNNHIALNKQISETLKIIKNAKKEFNQSRLKYI